MESQTKTLTFPVTGMTCAACANSVESMVRSQPGVEKAEVNYATQSVKVILMPIRFNRRHSKKQYSQ